MRRMSMISLRIRFDSVRVLARRAAVVWPRSGAAPLAVVVALVVAPSGTVAAKPSAQDQEQSRQYVAEGDRLREAGRAADAAAQYERALQLDDANAALYPRLGQALMSARNF